MFMERFIADTNETKLPLHKTTRTEVNHSYITSNFLKLYVSLRKKTTH